MWLGDILGVEMRGGLHTNLGMECGRVHGVKNRRNINGGWVKMGSSNISIVVGIIHLRLSISMVMNYC